MFKHVLVLLYKFVCSEVAVLIEKVDFEDLFAIWWVGISENVAYEKREKVSEGSVADIDGENVVVVGVEELSQQGSTSRAVKPPA